MKIFMFPCTADQPCKWLESLGIHQKGMWRRKCSCYLLLHANGSQPRFKEPFTQMEGSHSSLSRASRGVGLDAGVCRNLSFAQRIG